MSRQDDPSLDGNIRVFRRIPPDGGRVKWTAGKPEPSTFNFRDKDDELSVYLADETTAEKALEGHLDFGLVEFTLEKVRKIFADFGASLCICRDDEDPSNGHILICGKVTPGMSRRFKDAATWVENRWPSYLPP